MTTLFKITTRSNGCPAGNNDFKTKQNDGTWHMTATWSNGNVLLFSDREKAEAEAAKMSEHPSVVSAWVSEWTEDWRPNVLAG